MNPFAEKAIATLVASGIVAMLVFGMASMREPITLFTAEAAEIPAPVGAAAAPDSPAQAARVETVVFAGGCFWGVQGVFQHTRGVHSAVSGYAGGSESTARYDLVSDGETGHAEVVKVSYDPSQVSYAQLMQVFFSVVHDPTQLNYQGPDRGTQYRSAVFASTPAQVRATRAYIAQLEAAKAFRSPVVTTVESLKAFYPAESYHQDYLVRHPDQPYIRVHDLPKVAAFKRLYPGLYRDQPALVGQH